MPTCSLVLENSMHTPWPALHKRPLHQRHLLFLFWKSAPTHGKTFPRPHLDQSIFSLPKSHLAIRLPGFLRDDVSCFDWASFPKVEEQPVETCLSWKWGSRDALIPQSPPQPPLCFSLLDVTSTVWDVFMEGGWEEDILSQMYEVEKPRIE